MVLHIWSIYPYLEKHVSAKKQDGPDNLAEKNHTNNKSTYVSYLNFT